MTDYVSAYRLLSSPHQIEDAKRLAEKLRTETTIVDGVIRWQSNNSVPPQDCVALAAHIGLPVNVDLCDKTRDADTTAFLTEYRKRPRNDSAEARFERRAAFGRGKTVIDVASGQKYRT